MKRALLVVALSLVPGLATHDVAGTGPGDVRGARGPSLAQHGVLVELNEDAAGSSGQPDSDQTISATRLIGIRVVNPLDEEIGEVADLVLDRGGCAAGLIIRIGGFMGMGGEYVRIPIDKAHIRPQQPSGALIVLIRETRQNMLSR